MDGIEVSPVTSARLDRVPLASVVLESTPPLNEVRAVLGVPGAVLGLNQPKAAPRGQVERLGVVIHAIQTATGVDQVPSAAT